MGKSCQSSTCHEALSHRSDANVISNRCPEDSDAYIQTAQDLLSMDCSVSCPGDWGRLVLFSVMVAVIRKRTNNLSSCKIAYTLVLSLPVHE